MPALQNPRHERYAELIVEALNNGQPKPYCTSHAYIAAGYTAKDAGKPGSAQAASSRLLYRVINRVRELQTIGAQNAAETVEKMARELNEIQYEARADKAHAAAVAAVLGKAKLLNIGEQPSRNHKTIKPLDQCRISAESYCRLSDLLRPTMLLSLRRLRQTTHLFKRSRQFEIKRKPR